MTNIQIKDNTEKQIPKWPILEFGKWYQAEYDKQKFLLTLPRSNSPDVLAFRENGGMVVKDIIALHNSYTFIKEIKNLTITVDE